MPDVEGFLTRKVGPLPVWAYAAGGGALLSLLLLYRRGAQPAAGATPGGDAAQQQPVGVSPIIVTPGTMPSPAQAPTTSPALSTPVKAVVRGSNYSSSDQYWDKLGGLPVFAGAGQLAGTAVGYLPYGTTVTITAGPVQAVRPGAAPQQVQWWMISAPLQGWIPQDYLTSTPDASKLSGGGMGGGANPATYVSMGEGGGQVGRFRSPHAHPQYVNTAGMGGAALPTVAKRTGLPLIRLQALNPAHWRPGSGMSPDMVYVS